MKTSSDNKTIHTLIVLEENTREVFIVYNYDKNTGNLKYGGTIYTKINKQDKLGETDINYHKQTALNRYQKRPVEITIDKMIPDDKLPKKIRKCFYYHGVKGERLRNIDEMNLQKNNKLIDSYESVKSNSSVFSYTDTIKSPNPKKSPISDNYFDRFSFQIPDLQRWSRSSLSSIEDEEEEIRKFNKKINEITNTHRYVDNKRDIFIKTKFNKNTGNLNYGATIYKKINADDRLHTHDVTKHFYTAEQRLKKCPLSISYDHILMKNEGYDFLEEDIMYNLVDNIFYDINGKNKIKIRGTRSKI